MKQAAPEPTYGLEIETEDDVERRGRGPGVEVKLEGGFEKNSVQRGRGAT